MVRDVGFKLIKQKMQEIFYTSLRLQFRLGSAEATALTSGNVAATTELLESGRELD